MIDELHVGVTLFFVLSGFLIYYRYGGQPKEQFKFGKYLKFRFARIYPVYFLILALTFTFEEYPSPHLYWLNLTLLKGWSDAYKFTGIAQSWSLTVEETFYFLAPVIFFVLDRKKMGMAWIFAGAAICVLVMSETHQHFANWFGDWNFIFLYSFPGRICEFLLGILGAKYLLKSRESSPSCSFPFKTGLFSFAILASIASLALLKTEGLKFGVQDPWGILQQF
jgi:peptidoglycan/LPS O-acetylase OafA/YrhL